MATRSKPAPHQAAPDAGGEDLADVVRILAKITAGLVVHVSGLHARSSAPFRKIITQELRIGSDADVDAIEKFLRG